MGLQSLAPDAFTLTVKPKITTTHDEDYWEKLANRNGAVKYDTSAVPKGDAPGVVIPLAADDKIMAGCLVYTWGTGDNFRATMQVRSLRMPVKNNETTATALAAADYLKGVKGGGDGYLEIDRTAANTITGVVVVGGNTINDYAIAFDLTVPDSTA